MADRTIAALSGELVSLVQEVPAFSEGCFSVFDLSDLKVKSNHQAFPVVGVSFDGAVPNPGNQATPANSASRSTALVLIQFSVILGLQYNFSGQDDTKPHGTNLLDDLRTRISGYQGVNNRPWVWVGEKPEDDASDDGIIFYSQTWRTTVASVGKFNS
jgi:hypothetical protein